MPLILDFISWRVNELVEVGGDMKKLMTKLFVTNVVMAWLLFPGGAIAQSDGSVRPDTPQARAFFIRLQALLKEDNRKGVANVVEYPLITQLHGKKTLIRNRSMFLINFDGIFDKGIRCAILGSTDRDLWGNSHGFTINYNGNIGTIWFDGFRAPGETAYTYRLMTVNNSPLNSCAKQ